MPPARRPQRSIHSFERSVPRRRLTDPARHAAFEAIELQCARYPDIDALEPETANLDGRDAAFAHAIYDAALRRLLTLSALLKPFVARQPFAGLEASVKACLLGGAAQIMLLDRVPTHAAIDESVEWIKASTSPGAAGLVNAVLRRIGELRAAAVELPVSDRIDSDAPDVLIRSDGRGLRFSGPVWLGSDCERLASATSTPTALVERWVGAFGRETAATLAFHGLCDPPTIINVRHVAPALPLPEGLAPHSDTACRVFTGDRRHLEALLHARRDLWVQDAASCRAIALAADARPSRILDLCAGQGTKTRQLAATFPGAAIIATDQDQARVITLRKSTAHLGNVRVIPLVDLERERPFDLVLLDVPCSNTGVLARRVEARYRPLMPQLERLTAIQRDLLVCGESLVNPGGLILYSTCSLEAEEDEAMTRFMAGRGWKPLHEDRSLPTGLPNEPAAGYRDGAFSVLLGR